MRSSPGPLIGLAILAFNAYNVYYTRTGTMGVPGAFLWAVAGVCACFQSFWCAAVSDGLADLLKAKAATPAPAG